MKTILWRSAIGLVVLLLIVSFFIWRSLPDNFEVTDAWTTLRRQNMELATQVKNTIVQSDQDVALIGEKRNLPIIRLELSRKDIVHFADLYKKYENPKFGQDYYAQHNLWRKAKLEYDGRAFDVRIKSHGRSPTNHRSGKYISLAIKMPKGENINNSRRFSLLVRDHFVPKKQIVFDVADYFGVLTNQEELVRVKINHWDEKLYFFDRRLNDSLMEVEGRPSLRLFSHAFSNDSTDKSSTYTGGVFDEGAFRTRFQQTLVNLEYPESQHPAITDRFVAFNQMLADQRYEDLSEFCDMDYIASFQATRLATALIGHLARVDNLYIFFDTANGKFYPVITRDAWMEKMALLKNGSAELFVDTSGPWQQPFFQMLSRNVDVRTRAYQKLHRYIEEQGPHVRQRHREILERFEKLSYFGWATVGMREAGWLQDDFVANNLAVIQHFIETSKPKMKVTIDNDKLLLSLAPWSMSGIRMNKFVVETNQRLSPTPIPVSVWGEMIVDGKKTPIPIRQASARAFGSSLDLSEVIRELNFITPLNQKTQRVPRQYSILIKLQDQQLQLAQGNIEIQLTNSITGKPIDEFSAEGQFGQFDESLFPITQPRKPHADWIDAHPQSIVHLQQQTATIKAGEYVLHKDLILPRAVKLVIDQGVTLRLAKDVSIVGYAGIDVNGTSERPVTITSVDDDTSFGTVGILGTPDTHSTIRFLRLSHGYERWIRGTYFSAGLSLHDHGSVTMEHCNISDNAADDGLNIKYSTVSIGNCEFRDNAADQVDLDLCEGEVTDCRFSIDNRKDANGDGLDASGSTLTVNGCRFLGFPDKGMSVGESSTIQCRNSLFRSNTTGIAAKDSSHVFLVDNQYQKNLVDLDAFQKKTIFGGGTIWFSGTPSPTLRIFLDAKSRAFTTNSLATFAETIRKASQGTNEADWRAVSATAGSDPYWRMTPDQSQAAEATAP